MALLEPITYMLGDPHHRPILEGLDAAHIVPRAEQFSGCGRRPKTEPRHDATLAELA